MMRCMGCMTEHVGDSDVCPICGYVRGTPAREAYHLPPETVLHGRYIVGRVLGYGGFGVTYIGWDAGLERAVAIKEFLPSTFATRLPGDTLVSVYAGGATQQFTQGIARFLDEAQTLAQFNGVPGIVDIYDTFSANNTAYIIMQFLRGQDVKSVVAANGTLPYELAREIVIAVCDTLTAVHARGIIHRDLSPDNIFITQDNEIKLLDFGAARYESALNSKSLSVILKPGYAPEEQYRSRGEQGTWTDVYALAATFYKMVTGVTPPDSMERAVRDELKEPSKLGAQLPQSAENALLNALCVRRQDRTQTAAAFKDALLADGVVRTKVKQGKISVTRVPVAARVATAVSVCLLLMLGIYAASGGFDPDVVVEDGTKLEDTYGSAQKDGFATVPSLVGKTQAQAEQLLKDAGLTLVVGGCVFDAVQTDSPVITDQFPVPGQQQEKGAEVRVVLNLGDYETAVTQGWAPPLQGMGLQELLTFVGDGIARGDGFLLRCAYSGAQEKNIVLDVVPSVTDGGEKYYTVTIGCGENDAASSFGELRGAFLQGTQVRVCVATPDNFSAPQVEPNRSAVNHRLVLTSPQGEEIIVQGGAFGDEYPIIEGDPFEDSIFLSARALAAQFPHLAQTPLRVRVERYFDDGILLDSAELTQTFQFAVRQGTDSVERAEFLSQDDAEALFADGIFANDPMAELYLFSKEWAGKYKCVRVTGTFTQGSGQHLVWAGQEYWLQRQSATALVGFLPVQPPESPPSGESVYFATTSEHTDTDAQANVSVFVDTPIPLQIF